MSGPKWKIEYTGEFAVWYAELALRQKLQIDGRLSRIKNAGHFGDHRSVGSGVWELKWKNGRRLYYGYCPQQRVLLLLGGNKNGQGKDIRKARNLWEEYTRKE